MMLFSSPIASSSNRQRWVCKRVDFDLAPVRTLMYDGKLVAFGESEWLDALADYLNKNNVIVVL